MLLHSEGSTQALQSDADSVLEILCIAYPCHPWAVRVDGGVIFIRHLGSPNANWGMICKVNQINHDAAVLKREVITMAGEFLERAGLARGRYDESDIVKVEGVPERFLPQHIELKPTGVFEGDFREGHRQMSALSARGKNR
jgi:hypothetical protein